MYLLMAVLALTAASSIGWRILKERKRAARWRAIRQRQNAEALRNGIIAQQRANRDTVD
jgi:hypothetical protein